MAQTNVDKDVVRLRDKDKKAGKFSSLEKLASRKSNKMRVDALHKCIKAIEKLSVALDRESAQNKVRHDACPCHPYDKQTDSCQSLVVMRSR